MNERLEWEEAVYADLEALGELTRSDAQSLADAKGALLDGLFASATAPAAAAQALLAAAMVIS